MELRQLRYFAIVAEQGSVARAARKLRVAQPALSRQMHALERMVGVPLMERERRGMRLTEAGIRLQSGAAQLTAELEETQRRMALAYEGRIGRVRVALGRSAMNSPWITGAVSQMQKRFPGIELDFTEIDTADQARALRSQKIDVAVGMDRSTQPGIRVEKLYQDPLDSALVSAFNGVASKRGVDIATLKRQPLLLLDPALGHFPDLYRTVKRARFENVEYLDSQASLLSQIVGGRGWTFAPHSLRKHPLPATAVVPIADFAIPFDVVLRTRADDDSKLVANVVALLRRAGQQKTPSRGAADGAGKEEPPPAKVPLTLELRQLSALVATSEKGSLSGAAAQLKLTQSGVSRQVSALERAFGFPLVTRGAHGVALTGAGVELVAAATRIVDLYNQAIQDARDVTRGVGGHCTIGTVAIELLGPRFSSLMRRMTSDFPALSIEVREMNSWQQSAALLAREIDVGIAGNYQGREADPSILESPLIDDPIDCALIAATHPLARHKSLAPSDLADIPFLFGDHASYGKLHELVMHAFESIGLVPHTEATFSGQRVAWRLAADSMGWTLGVSSQRDNPPPGLTAVPIAGLHIPWGIAILRHRDESRSAVRAVVEAILETSGLSRTNAMAPSGKREP